MILIDNNLSYKLKSLFLKRDIEISHVYGEGLHRSSDMEVWRFAKSKGLTILTKDSDFHSIQSIHGFPPKIIYLKCGNCSTEKIRSILENSWLRINDFLQKDDLGIIEVS